MAKPERWKTLQLVILFSALSACSSQPRYDSGPSQSGSKAPPAVPADAIPRAEPRSRYGNGPYALGRTGAVGGRCRDGQGEVVAVIAGLLVVRKASGLDRYALRVITFEVCGIDFDLFDVAWMAEPQYYPVVARPSSTCRLPAVSHVDAATRKIEIVLAAVVLIAAKNRPAAVLNRRKLR